MPVPAGSRELLQKAQKGAVGGWGGGKTVYVFVLFWETRHICLSSELRMHLVYPRQTEMTLGTGIASHAWLLPRAQPWVVCLEAAY